MTNSNAPEKTFLAVSIPSDSLDQKARANLDAIIKAKGTLIKKALGTDNLPVLYGNGEISFPWFDENASPEDSKAYMELISKLCEFARNQQRVTAKEKDTDNEKYTFRCFLLRLGFIGDAYKNERKILLRNLTGSSAFRNGTRKEFEPGMDPVPTQENTAEVNVEEALERLQDPKVQEEIKEILYGDDSDVE